MRCSAGRRLRPPADQVRQGGGGFWARRYAKQARRPERAALRSLYPLMPILREDQDPEEPLELWVDLTGAAAVAARPSATRPRTRRAPTTRSSTRSTTTPWLQGRAQFADGAHVQLRGHRPRALLDKTKRTRAARSSARPRTRRRGADGHADRPEPQLRRRPAGRPRRPQAEAQAGLESHTKVKLERHARQPSTWTPSRRSGVMLELISGAYERVGPARRKKL